MEGAVAFAVVGGTATAPMAGYLSKPRPVTPELLALTAPVEPTEVLRFAAPCARGCCQHFDGSDCSLARRTVQLVPMAVRRLPPCAIRAECLWFRQEGRDACLRCPQVVTDDYRPTADLVAAAGPSQQEAP